MKHENLLKIIVSYNIPQYDILDHIQQQNNIQFI